MTDNTEENNHKIKSNKSEFIGFLNGYDIEKSKEAMEFIVTGKQIGRAHV